MLKISRKTDYGLLFLAYLAKNYDLRLVCLAEAAEKNHLPLPYLRQLAQKLAKARIIESKEGVGGGYKLTRRPAQITMSEVIKTLEGRLAPVSCLEETDHCSLETVCPTRKVWLTIYGDMLQKFKTTTLEELL